MYQNATHGNDRRRLAGAPQGVAQQQPTEPPALPSLVDRNRPSTAIGIGSGKSRRTRPDTSVTPKAPAARV